MNSNTQKTKKKIVVAGVPEHFNLPWHQSIENDQFDSLNVDVEFVEYRGGTGAMTKALREKQVDVALLLTEGCVADLMQGNDSKIVKVHIQSPLIWGIHVAAKSDIDSVDQMTGRRYAISRFGSGSHLMAIVDASERDWPVDGMEFVKVKNLSGARAELGKTADIFFWEKYTTNPYVLSGEFRRIGIRKTLWPAFVVCVRDDVLENDAALIRNILEVVNQSCQKLMEDPNATALIAERYGLKHDMVKQWFDMTQWNTDFEPPTEQLQTVREYLQNLDLIPDSDAKTEELWFQL